MTIFVQWWVLPRFLSHYVSAILLLAEIKKKFAKRMHLYIKRMQTNQYTQLLQKGPQGIRKLQPSPYCYCRSSTSGPAIDPHLFAKPRTQAAVLHHQSETKVQTMESCSTSSVTAHQPSGLSRRSCHTPSLAQRLAHARPVATRREEQTGVEEEEEPQFNSI